MCSSTGAARPGGATIPTRKTACATCWARFAPPDCRLRSPVTTREAASPLKLELPTGEQIEGLKPRAGDIVVVKDVNSGFVGTSLDIDLRRVGIRRLVVAGFFTNFCVETTVRMAGNMGYDVYLVEDACATTNRVGPDGADHDPELVHRLALASLHGEFCTAISTADAIRLCREDMPALTRCMGNE